MSGKETDNGLSMDRQAMLELGVGSARLRMCIINHTTTWEDVRRTLDTVVRFGEEALSQVVAEP